MNNDPSPHLAPNMNTPQNNANIKIVEGPAPDDSPARALIEWNQNGEIFNMTLLLQQQLKEEVLEIEEAIVQRVAVFGYPRE